MVLFRSDYQFPRGIRGRGLPIDIFRPRETKPQEHIEEAHSIWYEKTIKEISPYRDTLSKSDVKKYKLDLLMRVIKRVDSFSGMCGQCQLFQPEITELAQNLGNLIQVPNKEQRRDYFKAIDNIVKHLQTEHKLVNEGQYFGLWMTVGTGVGTALGIATGNTAIGAAIGIVLGLAIGAYMDRKAKAEGKII